MIFQQVGGYLTVAPGRTTDTAQVRKLRDKAPATFKCFTTSVAIETKPLGNFKKPEFYRTVSS